MSAVSAQSEPETAADVTALARRALTHWGIDEGEPELLKFRENAVFRVILPTGQPAAMRIHRLGYHTDAALRSELQWMGFLQSAGIATPSPVATPAGDLFVLVSANASVQPRQVDCLSWLEGRAVGARGVPLDFTPEQARQVFTAMGRTIAHMHNVTSAWTPPAGFARHAWDFDGFFGANPIWGRFETSPFLDGPRRELVFQARGKAVKALSEHERSARNFGIIHADLVRENVLVHDGAIRIIDFDDCGHGWHMYDLAVALYQNREEAIYPLIEAALLDGYRQERELTARDIAALPLFSALRAFAFLGWVQSRVEGDITRDVGMRMSAIAADVVIAYLRGD
ncbi:phosphotransferase [Mesorhizobium sp. M7A.F.Ca.US.010.02.1.1]|uniref:phosphotransferase enzyme family protein n=1 Tax=unclassified Mesorhizobium TaxID=325217 RepID=UPI000FD25D74|nr:phosphotransferase [Mesorhizobium sp. M7A.F.Ca.US.010.02.1.1]RUW89372.1 aminoglycoside phosphotransferase [Mesorhizobium sp. M7A.F.Ca.US.010.02.1.1]